ncbi:expressed unknown protein [Seminavis robusta]|uniref:Potassium channel domain-containing protein n=1 Tax=Seminavis robusta TaxID=568900 RepID=A0A9N8E6A9_9STRA|nr:expressed unknown protein [Seminavis robusta]|eukprot:Sro667_g184180.1 n/a (748) ;mRNA; f:30289-32725
MEESPDIPNSFRSSVSTNGPADSGSFDRRRAGMARRTSFGQSVRHSIATVQEYAPRTNYREWPRTLTCCFGVFIPLVVLVFISLVLGMLLGKLEMQSEIDSNNAAVSSQMAESKYKNTFATVMRKLPAICTALLHKNTSSAVDISLPALLEASMTDPQLLERYLQVPNNDNDANASSTTQSSKNKNKDMNYAAMAEFYANCGQAGATFQTNWLNNFAPLVDDDATMTFNFIRCVDRDSPLKFNLIVAPTPEDMEDAKPSNQADLFISSWEASQQALEQEYKNETYYTDLEAIMKSFEEATGGEKCSINAPASAWFWFTVMTTVGYGNQTPRTAGGRALTYTLGFLSILLFGGILATAGNITTHICNDFVHRCKKKSTGPIMILLWGILWLVWMFLIGWQQSSLEKIRLETYMSWEDAYWFAFISTTTVGLGDFYVAPEILFASDLLGLWATFLIGFVFLSSCLTELSQLLGKNMPDLAGDLQRQLKYAYDENNPDQVMNSRSGGRNSQRTDNNNNNNNNSNFNEGQPGGGGFSHPILGGGKSAFPDGSGHRPNSRKLQLPALTEGEDESASGVAEQSDPVFLKPTPPIAEESARPSPPKTTPPVAKTPPAAKTPKPAAAPEPPKTPEPPVVRKAPAAKAPKPPVAKTPPKTTSAKAPAAKFPKQSTRAPKKPAEPTPVTVTFKNNGTDPAMASAELFYGTKRWGPLGKGDAPIAVQSFAGQQWYIAANGVYAKLFTVGQDAQQTFSI